MKTDNKLSNVFGVDVTDIDEVTPLVPLDSNRSEDADMETSRSNLLNLLKSGDEALDYALRVAKESESPRSIEVVGDLIAKLANVNVQLTELSKKRGPRSTTNNVNAFFVGSTSDLSRMINDMKKKD